MGGYPLLTPAKVLPLNLLRAVRTPSQQSENHPLRVGFRSFVK